MHTNFNCVLMLIILLIVALIACGKIIDSLP